MHDGGAASTRAAGNDATATLESRRDFGGAVDVVCALSRAVESDGGGSIDQMMTARSLAGSEDHWKRGRFGRKGRWSSWW